LKPIGTSSGNDEGAPVKNLDRDVTVIDPRVAEAAFERDFKGVRTREDAERVAAEGLQRRLRDKEEEGATEREIPGGLGMATAEQERAFACGEGVWS